MIKAVTIDLWGTVVVDSPSTDERYRRERLAGLETTLLRFGFRVPAADLARAYGESSARGASRARHRGGARLEHAAHPRRGSPHHPEAPGRARSLRGDGVLGRV